MMTSLVKDGEGNPVYLLDQIQSDWGQKLRDAGGARNEEKIAELKSQLEDAKHKYNAAVERIGSVLAKDTETARKEAKSFDQSGIERGLRMDWDKASPIEVANAISDFVSDGQPYPGEASQRLAEAQDARVNMSNEVRRLQAEFDTADTATHGHPLVNTTSQWVTTTLRRAIRQAIEAGAERVAIPSGDTVLSYNPGDKHGMNEFYNKIVPLALKKIMRGHDPAYPNPEFAGHLETPARGMVNRGEGRERGPEQGYREPKYGFTVFPITESVKTSVEKGQPLFALGGRVKAVKKLAARARGGSVKYEPPSTYANKLLRKYAPLSH
jgi:hypothetical protein